MSDTTTAQQSAAQVEEADPRTLLVDANIRLNPAFVASIKDLGVLVPIVAVRTAKGAVRVRLDNRRTLGAIPPARSTPKASRSCHLVRLRRFLALRVVPRAAVGQFVGNLLVPLLLRFIRRFEFLRHSDDPAVDGAAPGDLHHHRSPAVVPVDQHRRSVVTGDQIANVVRGDHSHLPSDCPDRTALPHCTASRHADTARVYCTDQRNGITSL